MPIVGFNLNKILIEKKNPVKKDLKVKQNLLIKDIDKSKADVGSIDLIKFMFEFQLDYGQVGQVLMTGDVLYTADSKEIKNILEEWKKNKKLPTELGPQVFNTILFRCNVKALNLEQELNLPYHINLPRFKPAK